jgi:hypothetical protein
MAEDTKKLLHIGALQEPPMFRGGEWKKHHQPEVETGGLLPLLESQEENSFDGVFVAEGVERLYGHQVQPALTHLHRILRQEGRFIIAVPDMQGVAAFVAEGMMDDPLYQTPRGPLVPLNLLYGDSSAIADGREDMASHTGFTAKSLAKHMLAAGFSNVLVQREWLTLWAIGYKYPANHPGRKNSGRIVNQKLHGPKGKRFPIWYERLLELQANPENRFDDLEVPPQIWKPVGTNK